MMIIVHETVATTNDLLEWQIICFILSSLSIPNNFRGQLFNMSRMSPALRYFKVHVITIISIQQ